MKKLIIYTLLFFTIYSYSSALDGWYLQGTFGDYPMFGGLFFSDSLHGWLCSYSMKDIRATTDGGKNWYVIGYTPDQPPNSIFFPDSLHGWAVGINGSISFSTDGGGTWNRQITPGDYWGSLTDLYFSDSLHGIIIGAIHKWHDNNNYDAILTTFDGGTTWNLDTNYINQITNLNDICFIDKNNGWICDDHSRLFRTYNGGKTWDIIDFQMNGVNFYRVFFVDTSNGWIGTVNHGLMHTTDGGKTWEQQNCKTDDISDIFFLNKDTGWITSSSGIIEYTTNGGKHWALQQQVEGYLSKIQFVNPRQGWTLCSTGLVYHTKVGGIDLENPVPFWQETGLSEMIRINTLFIDMEQTLFGGALALYYSKDEAKNFTMRNQDNGLIEDSSKIDGNFCPEIYCLKQDKNGLLYAGTANFVYVSPDNGNTWFSKNNNRKLKDIPVSKMAVNNKGIVFASTGNSIYKTSDGGENWELIQSSYPIAGIIDIVVGKNDVLYSSMMATIVKSTDNGATWTKLTEQNVLGISTLAISKDDDLYYTANNGDISNAGVYHSVAGDNWQFSKIGIPNYGQFNSLFVDDNGTVYLADHEYSGADVIFYSTDKGQVWFALEPPYDRDIKSITVDKNGIIYIASRDGIYKSRERVLTGVNEIAQDDGMLIYPNPANNLINIKAQLDPNTELKITNILGETVKVPTVKGLGDNISINIIDLTAGIYFIVIKDSNHYNSQMFIKTK